MSGAVGSMPSLTRSGLPSFFAASSFFRSASAGRESTALRARDAASAADFDAFFGTAPMLNDRSPAPAPLDNAANRPWAVVLELAHEPAWAQPCVLVQLDSPVPRGTRT